MRRLFFALTPFILLAAGFLFIVLGINDIKHQKTYIPTTAVITDIEAVERGDDTDYEVYVEYSAEGTVYEERLDTYSASMKVGKELNVLYDPDDASHVVLKSKLGIVMYFGLGIVAAGAGVVTLIKKILGIG